MKVCTLKELRMQKDMNLIEASKKIGITHTYLCMLESGLRNPSDKLKIKLAKVYDVAPTTIFLACQSTKCKLQTVNS